MTVDEIEQGTTEVALPLFYYISHHNEGDDKI